MGVWNGSSCLKIGLVVGTCECGYENTGSLKFGEFFHQLRTGYLTKKDSLSK